MVTIVTLDKVLKVAFPSSPTSPTSNKIRAQTSSAPTRTNFNRTPTNKPGRSKPTLPATKFGRAVAKADKVLPATTKRKLKTTPQTTTSAIKHLCQRSAIATASHRAFSMHVSGKRSTSSSSSSSALQSRSIGIQPLRSAHRKNAATREIILLL